MHEHACPLMHHVNVLDTYIQHDVSDAGRQRPTGPSSVGEGVEGSNEPPLFIQYFIGKCVRKHPEAPQLIVRVFCVY